MRTTVGPLPPAVYWRRRAVVLGALLLVVIVLFVACSGRDDTNSKQGRNTSSQYPIPAPASSAPDEEPSFSDAKPGGGPSLPAPGDLTSQQPTLGDGMGASGAPNGQVQAGTNANVTAPTGATCGDAEMSVIPAPASTTVRRGTPVAIRLTIKNISARTCSRDVGADPQEVYIDRATRRYWSSDTCSTAHSSDVRQFPPGAERQYVVTWNGRQSSKCVGGQAAGPAPIPGQYEIRGRLGTKVSDPVILTIVA